MLLAILLLALAPQEAQEEPFVDPNLRIGIIPTGVQVPEQPQHASSATYGRTERSAPQPTHASRSRISTPVRSLVRVRGQEENSLVGVGLLTGLMGTGDSPNMTRQLVNNLLLASNIKIDPQQITAKNVALVRVEASLPAGAQPGTRIDVRISAMGDAKTLQGGTLTLMELTDITGTSVYATAAGPVNIGGFLVSGESATVVKNHVTVGVIPGGGKVERAVPSSIVSEHGYLYLDSRTNHGSFSNLVRIVEAINSLYPNAAEAVGNGRSVRVRVPQDLPEPMWVSYVDSILSREIEPSSIARLVINERTGLIVMGEGVRLRPGAVAHGNLTITIAETEESSQPGAFSEGATENLQRTDLQVVEDDNGLTYVPGAVTLQEVVEVLNVLGTTPRDLITVLEAMSRAGLLYAEIERM